MRRPLLVLLPLVLATLAGCEGPDAASVVSPELARSKGDHGKPGGSVTAPTLDEFFVYEGAGGQDYVHVVVDGPATVISFNSVFDHFQNGVRDDDPPFDTHYEFFHRGFAPDQPPEALGDGRVHVDIPFDGTFADYDPAIDDYRPATFFDHPYQDLDGNGADAYALRLVWQWDDGGTQTESMTPYSVIGSNDTGLHDGATTSTFARFKGAAAPSQVYVSAMSAAPARCSTTTVRSGKGKNRTEETVTQVDVDVSYTLGTSGVGDPADADPWVEFHLQDGDLLSYRASVIADAWSGTLTLELPAGSNLGDLRFIVDYVYPDAAWGVYDPGQNDVTTETGPDSEPVAFVSVDTSACS